MAAITYGESDMVFGIPDDLHKLRLTGFPLGATVKLRARQDDYLQAFVLQEGKASWWYVARKGNTLFPKHAKGCNLTVTQTTLGGNKTASQSPVSNCKVVQTINPYKK